MSEATGQEVPNDQIRKGYEIGPGQYVVVDDEEIRTLAPKSSRMIEIEDFVDLDDIDPLYFEQPYYLTPDATALKAYKLLVEAMAELHKVAIGRVVIRSKESLVAIRPLDGVLCLETMRYADEVLPRAGLLPQEAAPAEPSDREVAMARQLIEALAGRFEPERYHDEYREQLLDLIDRKAAGEEIVAEPTVEEPGKVVDLMAVLEASLARAGSPPAAEAGAPDAQPAKRARKRPGSRKSA